MLVTMTTGMGTAAVNSTEVVSTHPCIGDEDVGHGPVTQ